MANPVYQLWMAKPTEAYYALSEEAQDGFSVKSGEALAAVGGKTVIGCAAPWSSHQLEGWGVEEFPDFAAAQRHAEIMREPNWRRYFSGTVVLGIRYDAG